MKTRTSVLIKRNALGELISLSFPALEYHLELAKAPKSQEVLRRMGGLAPFLQHTVRRVIRNKKIRGEKFEDASTTAMITAGMSEMQTPVETYDVYFVAKKEDINPKNIEGNAIVVTGTLLSKTREAYFIEDYSFAKEPENKKIQKANITLTDEQLNALRKIKYDSKHRAEYLIEPTTTLYNIIEQATKATNRLYLGPNDSWETVFVPQQNHNNCRFFATIVPPLAKSTIGLEIALSTVLSIGSLELFNNPLFPPDKIIFTNSTTGNQTITFQPNTSGRVFNTTQAILSSLLALMMIFSGPGARSFGALGYLLDEKCYALYKKLCGKKQTKKSKEKPKPYDSTDIKIATANIALMLCILNNLITDILSDYAQIYAFSDMLVESKKSMFPDWFIRLCALIQFILNQLNDPLMIFSFATYGSFIIKYYLRPDNKLKNLNALVHSEKKSQILEVKIDRFEENKEERIEPEEKSSKSQVELLSLDSTKSPTTEKNLKQPLIAKTGMFAKSKPTESEEYLPPKPLVTKSEESSMCLVM